MKKARHFVVERWECTEGLTVDVYRAGSLIRTGIVDLTAPFGDCVWIAADGEAGRMLVHKSEGYILAVDHHHAAFLCGLSSEAA